MAPKDGAARRPPRGPAAAGRGDRRSGGGITRGGIQKRNGKVPPVDADGDRTMGGSGTGSTGGTRGRRGDRRAARAGRDTRVADSIRGNRIARAVQAGQGNIIANRITDKNNEDWSARVRVWGLKQSKAAQTHADGGLKIFLEFAARKASHLRPESTVRVKQSHFEGDWLILNASPEDAAKVVLLNGFAFAGQKLIIQAMDPGQEYKVKDKKKELSEEAQETLKNIRAVLEERYVAQDKLLNLSALGQDEKLVKMGFFEDTHTVGKLFPVMMVVCNDIFDEPEKKVEFISSISLSGNAISNVSMVNDLADTFPDLINLDLEFNQIQDLRGLDVWRHQFRNLERLRLNGNPITDIPSDYKERLMQWYPKLHVLNDIQIRTEGEVALAIVQAKMAQDVTPIPIGDWDFRDVATVAQDFLPKFIHLFDQDRNGLADLYYDDQSVHSISVNNRAPRRSEQQKEAVAPWDAYIHKSRNLAKITHLPARMSRTHTGQAAIKAFWQTLPQSSHPDLSTGKDKWIVDCHSLPGIPVADPATAASNPHGVDGLIISVHGEFEEVDLLSPTTRNIRSFSRTLIIGPGRAGGDSIRVVSDIMVYRAHNLLPQVSELTLPEQPVNEVLAKQELAKQLSDHTRMTLEFAQICLQQTNWDRDASLAYFNAHKDEIPANGWINGIKPSI